MGWDLRVSAYMTARVSGVIKQSRYARNYSSAAANGLHWEVKLLNL
jgi:hypothetical protein